MSRFHLETLDIVNVKGLDLPGVQVRIAAPRTAAFEPALRGLSQRRPA